MVPKSLGQGGDKLLSLWDIPNGDGRGHGCNPTQRASCCASLHSSSCLVTEYLLPVCFPVRPLLRIQSEQFGFHGPTLVITFTIIYPK